MGAGWTLVGRVATLARYPVKSMAGDPVERLAITKSGLLGDRNYAFVKPRLASFPWFTARDYAPLLRYTPRYSRPDNPRIAKVAVTTPDGRQLDVASPELLGELSAAARRPLTLLRRGGGLPDSMAVSLIGEATVAAIAERAGVDDKPARFRPNLVVETSEAREGAEDAWVGGLLRIGEGAGALVLGVVELDPRCEMINLDPETAEASPQVFKEVARSRQGNAGVYASVFCPGTAAVGDRLFFHTLPSA